MSLGKTVKGWFGADGERSLWHEITTEELRIKDEKLPVKKGCAESEETMEAWRMDTANVIFDRLEKGERLFSLVNERDVNPYPLWQKNPDKFNQEEMNKIAAASTDQALILAARKEHESHTWWLILTCLAIIGIGIMLTVGVSSCQGALKNGIHLW